MGNSGTFITTVAALGLVSLLAAQAGQAGESRYIAVQPATGDAAVSAWKAEQVWSETVMEDAMRLDLALVDGALSGEAVARLAAIAPAAGPETVDPDDAILALRKLSGDAISVLRDAQLDQSRRTAKFHSLMLRDFDIPLMARFALGRYWKRADVKQRSAYVEAFSAFMLHHYASKIAGGKVAAFDVKSARRAGKRDVMVQSRITRGNGQVLKLVWRMRRRDGQFRVIDVVAEGISLALTKRQEFAAIIKANGGNVAQLIDRLKEIPA